MDLAALLLQVEDKAVLDALAGGDGLRTAELAKTTGLSARATRLRLVRLAVLGKVREIGSGPNDAQRRYFAVE